MVDLTGDYECDLTRPAPATVGTTSRTAPNKIHSSRNEPKGMSETTTGGTVDTASGNEARVINLDTCLQEWQTTERCKQWACWHGWKCAGRRVL